MDLSARALSELKEIAKGFAIDTKSLSKADLVLKIIDAQTANPALANDLATKFSKKEKRNQVVVSLQSVSVRYTKMSHEIWLVDIRSIESRPTILS